VNLCGVVVVVMVEEVWECAFVVDFVSVFGCVVVFNCFVLVVFGVCIVEYFVEVLFVFDYDDFVVIVLCFKKLLCILFDCECCFEILGECDVKCVFGGLFV